MQILIHFRYFLNSNPRLRYLMIFLAFLFSVQVYSQQANISCNEKTALTSTAFSVVEIHADSLLSFWQSTVSTPANLINASLTDFAQANINQTGFVKVTVVGTDPSVIYDAGDYAGFVISSSAFSGGFFNSVRIKTYLNSILRESYVGSTLTGFSPTFLASPINLGFVTSRTFNRVELTIDGSLGANTYNVYYATLEKYCAGVLSVCNVATPMRNPGYPVSVNYALTGSNTLSAGFVDNPEGAVSAGTTNFASLVNQPGVDGKTFLSVKENLASFAVGSFLGFDIQNMNIQGTKILSYLQLNTYLHGVAVDSVSGNNLFIAGPMSGTHGRQTIGFMTINLADEVRLTIHQDLSVALATTKVYDLISEPTCAGAALNCNTIAQQRTPYYPMVISGQNTGVTGAPCPLCDVQDAGNVVDEDSTNYGQIIISAGSTSIGSLSVKDIMTDYSEGTFAGYQIENTTLSNPVLFSGITLSTYLNGVLKESHTGTELLSIRSEFLIDTGQYILGFITTLPFDEVKISTSNPGSFNIGTTKIYNMVTDKLCSASISCDSTFWLMNPEFPVVINANRTGMSGIPCNTCSVQNASNVITMSADDYSQITIAGDSSATGSISVVDLLNTYSAGTITGFAIRDLSNLQQAYLFKTIVISTYNNGVFQESAVADHLMDANLTVDWIAPDTGVYNIGLITTLPFDEVRITMRSLPGMDHAINVYGAFVYTRASTINGISCLPLSLSVNWLSFRADKKGNKSELTWSTTQERNNAGYDIERSSDGQKFAFIGKVLPGEASAAINNYFFTDERPLGGHNYYRIKQIDFDGNADYSQIRMVSFSGVHSEIKTWPNPASQHLTIDLGNTRASGEIKMLNSTGVEVWKGQFGDRETQTEIDISALAQGVYNLIIETPFNRYVQKIVVLK